jgi:hypothetical protein
LVWDTLFRRWKFVQDRCQANVCYQDAAFFIKENVTGSEVPVDYPLGMGVI